METKKIKCQWIKIRTHKTSFGSTGKKEKVLKRLTDAMQEDNSDKQSSISLIKEIFLNMLEEQKKKKY